MSYGVTHPDLLQKAMCAEEGKSILTRFLSEHLRFEQYITIRKKVRGFNNIFSRIFKFYENPTLLDTHFCNFEHPQNLGLIDPAVLTFFGYRQTDRQRNKQLDTQSSQVIYIN